MVISLFRFLGFHMFWIFVNFIEVLKVTAAPSLVILVYYFLKLAVSVITSPFLLSILFLCIFSLPVGLLVFLLNSVRGLWGLSLVSCIIPRIFGFLNEFLCPYGYHFPPCFLCCICWPFVISFPKLISCVFSQIYALGTACCVARIFTQSTFMSPAPNILRLSS